MALEWVWPLEWVWHWGGCGHWEGVVIGAGVAIGADVAIGVGVAIEVDVTPNVAVCNDDTDRELLCVVNDDSVSMTVVALIPTELVEVVTTTVLVGAGKLKSKSSSPLCKGTSRWLILLKESYVNHHVLWSIICEVSRHHFTWYPCQLDYITSSEVKLHIIW